MKKYFLRRFVFIIRIALLLANPAMAASSTITFTVHGVITDEETKQPLVGVAVTLHDGTAGTVTDAKGRFNLDVTLNDERGLIDISYVGYEKKTISIANDGQEVKMTMHPTQVMTKEVVVSASRIPERIMESPVSIEKITAQEIEETTSNNFYESVANLKDIDIVTSSIAFKSINMRGFGNTENPGFVQLIDGADNQAPGLNYSVGYAINDLDVDNVEIIPGAASALYGANAFSGIMNVTSKDPFRYQGLSFQEKIGVNHTDGIDHAPAPLSDFQLRYAKAFDRHFAFKVNAEYFKGTDWVANNTTDVSAIKTPGFEGVSNPSYDGLNVYGDEVSTALPIGPGGSPVVVSRTGYNEKDLMNYDAHYVKYDASLYYRFNDRTELSYTYKSSLTDAILHSANRYALQGFGLDQQKVEFKTPDFFIRAYTNGESSGKSYDTRMLAINMDESWKNSNQWFTDYATAYLGGAPGVTPGDYTAASDYANIGRPLPGSVRFNQLKDSIASIVGPSNGGAGFSDHTRMYNVETQYNFTDKVKFVELLTGGNMRYFNLNSEGTLYADAPGNPLHYYEVGAYAQVGKKFLNNKLKLTAAMRYDKSENYEGQVSPRFSAVYDLGHDNFLRASYQTGYRMPTSQDQYIDLNLGGERVIGGLPSIVNPYDVVGKVFTMESVTNYANGVQDYIAQHPMDSMVVVNAVEKNKSLLTPLNYTYVKPETEQSIEIGYKGLVGNNRLFYDLSTYYTIHHDFIGYYNAVRPQTGSTANGDSITSAAYSLVDPSQTASAFLLTSNLPGNVNTYGVALAVGYHLPGDYVLTGNITYSKLDKSSDVEASTLFNTPTYKTNMGISNKNIYKNVGFAVNWRWTDSYLWESLFGNGMLTAANTVDAQVSYRFPKVGTTLKLGATDALNYRHTDVYGGGTVGAIYYLSLRYDGLFDKKN